MISHQRTRVNVCGSVLEANLSISAGVHLPLHCKSAGYLRTLAPALSPQRTAAPTPQTPIPRLAARTAPHLTPLSPSPLPVQKGVGNKGRSRVGAGQCYAHVASQEKDTQVG